MQFVDKVTIQLSSGAGGNGIVAWRREKYEPFGGPAGGDGGRGGHIYLTASKDLNTLLEFKYQSLFKAEDGQNGRHKNQHGGRGEDLIIKVPCGTVVRDGETKQAIADLTHEGDQVLVAAGGRGGRGNSRFTSSKRQAPQFCEPGESGIERTLELELKLIADVGIIGLPNAGKSTLISVISAAKPKIADYPFTTLVPNIGVVRRPSGDGVLVADIPGLIEGASEGQGLGHEFLRHVERTRLLLHLVDLSQGLSEETEENDPVANYELINSELVKYSERLSQKPQIVVLTKIDTVPPDVVTTYQARFQALTQRPVLAISSVAHLGLEPLKATLFEWLDKLSPVDAVVPVVADPKAYDHDDSAFEIERKGRIFYVSGGKIGRLIGVMDPRNETAVFRTMNILRAMGLYQALEDAGIHEGETVNIHGMEFEYIPED